MTQTTELSRIDVFCIYIFRVGRVDVIVICCHTVGSGLKILAQKNTWLIRLGFHPQIYCYQISLYYKRNIKQAVYIELQKKFIFMFYIAFQSSRLAPSTPLTGRKYLTEKTETFTPVTTATQSVHRLKGLLSGQKIGPSDALKEMFRLVSGFM